MRIYLENIKDRVRYIIRMREDLVDNGLKVAAGEGALSVVVTFVISMPAALTIVTIIVATIFRRRSTT